MYKKSKVLFFIGFILLLIFSPMLLTLPNFNEYFDFSNTGEIGDTIGGITAPFINLLGAILVYLSFNEQLKANNIQKNELLNEITRNYNEKQFNSIIHDIDNLRLDISEYKLIGGTETGSNAIFQFKSIAEKNSDENFIKKPHFIQMLENLGFLIKLADDILIRINKSGLVKEDKVNLRNKLIYLYSTKVGVFAEDIISSFIKNSINISTISVMQKLNQKLSEELLKMKED